MNTLIIYNDINFINALSSSLKLIYPYMTIHIYKHYHKHHIPYQFLFIDTLSQEGQEISLLFKQHYPYTTIIHITNNSSITTPFQIRKPFFHEDFISFIQLFHTHNPYDHILYIESFGHHIIIHTFQDKQTIRTSLKDLIHTLPDYFIRIHQSYIINTHYIYKRNYYYIYLLNDHYISLPIGNTYRDKIENAKD